MIYRLIYRLLEINRYFEVSFFEKNLNKNNVRKSYQSITRIKTKSESKIPFF